MAEKPVALVTGTSRGLGNQLARHLVSRGYHVVGCSRSAYDGLDGDSYEHHVVELAHEPSVVRLFDALRSTHGRLDVVVNNAAVDEARTLVALTSAEAAATTLNTNVLGTFVVCREAVKLMMRRRYGRIVNIGSMATRHEVPGEAVYTASKAAVIALTRVLAKEVADAGITCNVVAPSALEDGLTTSLPAESVREVLARNALARPDTVSDVTSVIEWLLQPESGAVTGQVIYLGGA